MCSDTASTSSKRKMLWRLCNTAYANTKKALLSIKRAFSYATSRFSSLFSDIIPHISSNTHYSIPLSSDIIRKTALLGLLSLHRKREAFGRKTLSSRPGAGIGSFPNDLEYIRRNEFTSRASVHFMCHCMVVHLSAESCLLLRHVDFMIINRFTTQSSG